MSSPIGGHVLPNKKSKLGSMVHCTTDIEDLDVEERNSENRGGIEGENSDDIDEVGEEE